MAFSTPNFWFRDCPVHFGAIRIDLNPAFEFDKFPFDIGFQYHVGTGVCQQNMRDRAGFTQIRSPVVRRGCNPNQAAFFIFSAAKIIAIKILTFISGWCFHFISYLTNAISSPGRDLEFIDLGHSNSTYCNYAVTRVT